MAQPVYDDQGPLESYLRSAGEGDFVPGDLDGSMWDEDESFNSVDDGENSSELLQTLPESLSYLWTMVSGHSTRASSSSFRERFKYDVVSSSLLASELQEHPPTTYSPVDPEPPITPSMPSFPGELLDNSPGTSDIRWLLALGGVAGLVTSIYCQLSDQTTDKALTLLSSAIMYITCVPVSQTSSPLAPEMTSTLHALHDLISASNAWDSVVQDALAHIESDEVRFKLPASSNPFTPSSPLRIATQTSLHTTATQCDNVRTLMSAITKQSELTQLAEMYAPTSYLSISPLPRPMSLPLEQQQAQALEEEAITDISQKRQTWSVGNSPTSPQDRWNGSYASMANAGSPTMRVMKRREKRRSDLSALLSTPSVLGTPPSRSPVSPARPELSIAEEEPFGPSALAMRRKRQSTSLMTRLAPSRHPLSLSSLTQSLHSALQAKRYTCAHLLALRFDEEEEGSDYWEDVRSVMSLLTSTFSEVAVRLTEAMETEEETRINDEKPSRTPSWNLSSVPSSSSTRVSDGNRPSGFAPSLGSLARFGLHAQGVISALDDARGHLDECLDVLRKSEDNPSLGLEDVQDHPALAAYDRLRRELGIALRECERGREKLLDLVKPPQPQVVSEEEEDVHIPADDTPQVPPATEEEEEETEGEIVEAGVDLPLETISAQLERLEPPGVEQIFESDEMADNAPFLRERSKLSREERIQQAKKAREEAAAMNEDPTRHWGPEGDVVQELKDVIWQVGQRKRKLRESLQQPPRTSPPQLPLPPIPPPEPSVENTPSSCRTALPVEP